jgi:hypothetical protein
MPADHPSQTIENPTPVQANRPTPLIPLLAADWWCRASCSQRKQPLNRKPIHPLQPTGKRQPLVRPRFLPPEWALKRGAIRPPAEPSVPSALAPASERAAASPLPSEPDSAGHPLARIPFRIAFARHNPQPILDSTQNQEDPLFRRHETPSIGLQHLSGRFFS